MTTRFFLKTFFYIHIYVSAELFFNMQLGTTGAANLIVFWGKKNNNGGSSPAEIDVPSAALPLLLRPQLHLSR